MLKIARSKRYPKSMLKSRMLKKKPVESQPDKIPSKRSRTKAFQR
jgi:hypothetical protein